MTFIVAAVTLAYGLFAISLALPPKSHPGRLRILVYANWFWTLVSVVLLILYLPGATIFGAIFLVLQVLVVGGLAWLEGRQLILIKRQPV
ncbi:hypothetical protein [Paraflavitalea speifideaquila]|uniref:hypothetical protein n=1 Tax=Paraflavitalea speifideaquila TaxID=3076558 RepID=UPI0028E9D9FA|nr:hypothetical protein [Paraflavitalea speifideiaquila]